MIMHTAPPCHMSGSEPVDFCTSAHCLLQGRYRTNREFCQELICLTISVCAAEITSYTPAADHAFGQLSPNPHYLARSAASGVVIRAKCPSGLTYGNRDGPFYCSE